MHMYDPSSKYVIVACHRGDWRNYPENSIPAIESVIRMGADIMELDLKMTKDSVLVLSHDKTINRCTNGKGNVADYTYEELMRFCLRRAHGKIVDTLRIPTLREALQVCKDRICVNVDQGYEYYDQVIAIAEELGVVDQILIKSNNPIELVEAKQKKYLHNLMYMPVINLQSKEGQNLFNCYLTSSAPIAYEICWSVSDGAFEKACREIRHQGSKIWINTLYPSLCGGYGNDDDEAYQSGKPHDVYGKFLDLGVSMIQTDRPDLLIDYLKSIGRH